MFMFTVTAGMLPLLSVVVVLLLILLAVLSAANSKKKLLSASPAMPGPTPWPVLGDLHLLGKYPNPFIGFTELAKIHGDIYGLTLGSTKCVVVNSYPLIKEVLMIKGAQFGGRPDFIRFHQLFGGDRNNSLALCDWSPLQKTRRAMARTYCYPRLTSPNYDLLDKVGSSEIQHFLTAVKEHVEGPQGNQEFFVKPLIMAACANMFTQYMCSTRFSYEDQGFRKMVRDFDELFWDINNGYAVDFLPWLLPFYNNLMNKLSNWSKDIRQFISSRVVEEHQKTLSRDLPPRDFTDALLLHLEKDADLDYESVLFELEDLVGGHSAIGNLAMLVLAAVLKDPEVGDRIRKEVDGVTKGVREVTLHERDQLPYLDAVILEVIRTSSSPIVPHVATEDTTVGGYSVSKGTVVFLNNYELNLGETYWSQPEQFRPERFLVDNKVVRPQHFIPFSTGKRTCLGQRLVHSFCFRIVASLLRNYEISADMDNVKTVPACVALPPDTFAIRFTPRQ